MKFLTTIIILICHLNLFGQNEIYGCYGDGFFSQIQFNTNHTFEYTWSFDLISSWTYGTWALENDTVYLHMISITDTVGLFNHGLIPVDSLLVSIDNTSERYSYQEYKDLNYSLPLIGQNKKPHPKKLFYKKDRLYYIENGKRIVKKQWPIKKQKVFNRGKKQTLGLSEERVLGGQP